MNLAIACFEIRRTSAKRKQENETNKSTPEASGESGAGSGSSAKKGKLIIVAESNIIKRCTRVNRY